MIKTEKKPAPRRRLLVTRLTIIAVAVLTCIVSPGLLAAEAVPPGAEMERRLQSTMDQLVESGVPGVTVHVRDDDRRVDLTSGVADLTSQRPTSPKDRIRVGSITKSFTAIVALQLAAERKLDLDDTVDSWLPGLVRGNGNDGRRITIRMLLNHTSGLPEYLVAQDQQVFQSYFATNDYKRVWTPKKLVKLAMTEPPAYPPGEQATYNNTNYVLAGMIIQRATGHRVSAEVERRIIKPLMLHDTAFPDTDAHIRGRHMTGYLSNFYYPYVNVTTFSPSWAGAAGAIISTPTDVATFERAVFSGALLPPEQQEELTTGVPTPLEGVSNGLGFAHSTECGKDIWAKDGAFPGYGSDSASIEDGSRQIVIATNSDSAVFKDKEIAALMEKLKTIALCAS